MTVDTIRLILRGVHIAAGSLVLMVGVLAMVAVKGGDTHRLLGKAFVLLGRILIGAAMISISWSLIDIESFLTRATPEQAAEAREILPPVFSVIGVLGLMVAHDYERAVTVLRRAPERARRAPHVVALAVAPCVAGIATSVWGLLMISDGRTGLGAVLAFVGALGATPVLAYRKPAEQRLITHSRAMIDALAGFVAAFALFGVGRVLDYNIFSGGPTLIVLIGVLTIIFEGLKRYWIRRVNSGTALPSRHDPVDLSMPGNSPA